MPTYPKFRSDLEAFEHRESGGQKTVLLKDPVSQKYFRLSDYEYCFLKVLDGTMSADSAVQALKATGRYYSPEDVKQIIARASQAGVLLGTNYGTAKVQISLKHQLQKWKNAQRLSSVYFLFIPLLNPDRFLERTIKFFNLLWNKWTAALAALLLPGAVFFIIAGMPKIQREFLFFFNVSNLLYLWVTIVLSRLAHELAHAYTAKKFGLHVPQMGIAFLIFFPCLYCNTTDAWQLADRRQRMAISAAGVGAETVLAIFATYIWHLSQPGIVNSLAFYLMGVSLISTLLINGNPLLKFDGYFLLVDYLRLPNLYQKAFGYIKYLFINKVLGTPRISDPSTSTREKIIFATYGFSSFAYRIFLYFGIIVSVYYRFDKTIGILMALLAFGLFLVRPAVKGSVNLVRHRAEINPRPTESLILAFLVILIVAVIFVPIPSNSVYPCFLDSGRKQKLAMPLHTWLDKANVREGTTVRKGGILFQLDPSILKLNLVKKETNRDIIRNELDLLLLDDRRRAEIPGKQLELFQAEDEIFLIKQQLMEAESGIIAPFNGVVTKLDSRMKPGFQSGQGIVIGELESLTEYMVRALIPEVAFHKVFLGQEVRVWFPIGSGVEFKGIIHDIKPFSEKDLSESPFSSRFGGELATEIKSHDQKDSPLEAQYDCIIVLSQGDLKLPLGMTGRLIVLSPPQSLAARIIDKVTQTFRKESLI